MFKKLNLLVLIMLLCLSFAEPVVLATIDKNNVITEDDLQTRFNALPAQYASYYSSAEGKKKLLQQLVDEKLLYLEAKASGLDTNQEVIKTTEKLKEEVMTNYYLKEEMTKLTVTDKEIKDYYDTNKEKYETKESVRASHILVKTEAEASTVLKELQKKGADFAEIAKKKSTCPSAPKGGDLDYFTKGQMVEPFEKAAFALKVGEVTAKPVQTQFGWHIIKATDHQPAKLKELDEVKTELRSDLLREKQKVRIDELLAAAKEKFKVTEN